MAEMIESFKGSFDTWGYVVLFLYCIGSGYVGIIAAGILSALGHMNISLSIGIAALGNFTGSSVLTYLVRYQKQDFLKYLDKHRRKIALMHIWLKKYGAILIFVNKFLYGVKFLVPVAIGMSRYSFKKFLLLNLLSCIAWALSLGMLAFYGSRFIESIIDKYGQYSYIIIIGIFTIIGAFMLWLNKQSKLKR